MVEGEQFNLSEAPNLPQNDSFSDVESVTSVDMGATSPKNSRVKKYPESSNGPFVVFFRQQKDPLNVLLIADKLHKLYRSIKEVKKVNMCKLRALFADRNDANAVVSNASLTSLYRVYIPCDQVEISGVVYDEVLDVESILDRGFGQFKHRSLPKIPILECERLVTKTINNGNIVYVPSNAIRITFSGTALPNFLNIDNVLLRLRLFTPKLMQCDRCQSFGHTVKFCTRKVKCSKCAGPHQSDSCDTPSEICIQCKGTHESPKSCAAYVTCKQKVRERIVSRSKFSYSDLLKTSNTTMPVVSNVYDSLGEISLDFDDEQAHHSGFQPAKRRKRQLEKPKKKRDEITLPPSPSDADLLSKRSKDWPYLPNLQDIPGFQRVTTAESNLSSVQNALLKLTDFICNALNLEKRWNDLAKKIIPTLSPFVSKLCDKLPLLNLLIELNG